MKRILVATAALACVLISPSSAFAEDGQDASKAALEQRVEQLEKELKALKEERSEPADEEAAEPDAGTTAPPPPVPATRPAPSSHTMLWNITGYANAGLVLSDDSTEEGAEDTFVSGQANPTFHFQYKNLVLFESEVELEVEEDGATAIELEYSQINVFLHDYATFVIGKFLSPIGQFRERLHPSWVNKLADAPAGFHHDGADPETDVGVQLRGGIPLGGTVLTYALALGNGPRMEDEGFAEFEGFGADDNDNKAFSGRIGFLPLPYLEVGGSFLTATVSGLEGEFGPEPSDADITLWGADAAYTRGPWDVRFEYLHIHRDAILSAVEDEPVVSFLDPLERQAWYAQIAYRLSGLTEQRVLRNFEPVFRVSDYKVDGLEELEEEVAERRYDFGLNYWIAPTIVARGVVQWRDFTGREEEEDNTDTRYLFQFAYGF